jgi:hypothetical protein
MIRRLLFPNGIATACRRILPRPRSLNERCLRRLSFKATGSNGGSVRLPAPDPGLLVFVQSRCFASYRIAAAVARHWEIDPPEFTLTLVLVDEPANRARFLAGMPPGMQVIGVRPARLPRRLVAGVPCAVSVGRGRQVKHAGGISGPLEFVRFTEACGDYQIRHWCRAVFTEWARAADTGSP